MLPSDINMVYFPTDTIVTEWEASGETEPKGSGLSFVRFTTFIFTHYTNLQPMHVHKKALWDSCTYLQSECKQLYYLFEMGLRDLVAAPVTPSVC